LPSEKSLQIFIKSTILAILDFRNNGKLKFSEKTEIMEIVLITQEFKVFMKHGKSKISGEFEKFKYHGFLKNLKFLKPLKICNCQGIKIPKIEKFNV